jgi:hypothetical protein
MMHLQQESFSLDAVEMFGFVSHLQQCRSIVGIYTPTYIDPSEYTWLTVRTHVRVQCSKKVMPVLTQMMAQVRSPSQQRHTGRGGRHVAGCWVSQHGSPDWRHCSKGHSSCRHHGPGQVHPGIHRERVLGKVQVCSSKGGKRTSMLYHAGGCCSVQDHRLPHTCTVPRSFLSAAPKL